MIQPECVCIRQEVKILSMGAGHDRGEKPLQLGGHQLWAAEEETSLDSRSAVL